MGDAVDLHPAIVIISIIVAASLFGIWGAILAAPVVALGRDLYRYGFRRLEGGTTDEARIYATAGPPPDPRPPDAPPDTPPGPPPSAAEAA
jgi:hypothetical protein